MKIEYKDVILRDYRKEDINDDIRWMTEEISWAEWDAPWEAKATIENFDQAEFIRKKMEKLSKIKDDNDFRWQFEIDTKEGVHIGGVNSYLNDRDFHWKSEAEGGCLHTLGIDICESAYWHKGYGTQAFTAFINYHLSRGIDALYTETWSGNGPMMAMAEKFGFEMCHVQENFREVSGRPYDGLTFKLNVKKFHDFCDRKHLQQGENS